MASNKGPQSEQTDTDTKKMESAQALEELRRVQIANEGMRLLLSSRLREAEDLFGQSRFVVDVTSVDLFV